MLILFCDALFESKPRSLGVASLATRASAGLVSFLAMTTLAWTVALTATIARVSLIGAVVHIYSQVKSSSDKIC